MNFNKLFLLVILSIIILFLMPSCRKNNTITKIPKQEDTIVLGFSQIGAESDWRTANSKSIKEAAKSKGIQLKFKDAQQKQENQILAIRSFIAHRVDIIAFSPIVEEGWDSVLKEAKNAGIPVILTDRNIKTDDESLYVTLIGSDFYEEGKRAANWLVKKIGKTKKQVNIVELEGTPGSAPAIDRSAGFKSIINKYSNIKIIKRGNGDFLRSKGKEVMEEILKERKKIDVLFAHNDDMALGAIEAIEDYNLKPGEDIIIVSVDANREAFKAMIEGKLNCSVECNPLIGNQLMEAVESILAGINVKKRITIKEGVFPQEIALKEFMNREY